MGECKLNHSKEDVEKKLAEQAPFLSEARVGQFQRMLEGELSQERLNELFHLLKKYDLASPEERLAREQQMDRLFG
ncbi:50S ribosomal protein L7ae [Brevibacillus gelatini]|uniref:50S ribosomal protein L7ae n=1 Tax=Brevibacillus gelatini TaxID=1655277 RepID=A0A3M8ARB5_9BACL|nr:50S ribosomal protein L7ae [Brevibacillus gelatini]RNB53730.1 50S ribosomal protein L7ae [Brevibacillus gelatini]